MLEQHIVIEEHFGLSPFWTMAYATAASYTARTKVEEEEDQRKKRSKRC